MKSLLNARNANALLGYSASITCQLSTISGVVISEASGGTLGDF